MSRSQCLRSLICVSILACFSGCLPQIGDLPDSSAKPRNAAGRQTPDGNGTPTAAAKEKGDRDTDKRFAKAQQLEELARKQHDRGKVKESAKHYREAADLLQGIQSAEGKLSAEQGELLSTVLYDLACNLALSGQREPALQALKDSVVAGWNDVEQLESDSDLDSLRKLPGFAEIVPLAKKLAEERLRNELAEFKPFEFDFTLDDLDGKSVSLAEFKGKVLIVDLWATWCPPCRKEVPHFIRLVKEQKSAGLEVVGLNFERESGEAAQKKIRKFMNDKGINYRCAEGNEDIEEQVPDFDGLPTTLFFDRQGRVRLKLEGYHSYEHLSLVARILLEEK